MQMAVLELFPKAEAEYRFTNRGSQRFSEEFVEELRRVIDEEISALLLTEVEYRWLGENCSFLKPMYLEYLKNFRLKPGEVKVCLTEEKELARRFRELRRLFPRSKRVNYYRRVFNNQTGFLSIPKKTTSSKYRLCPYPWFSFIVASSGDVVACCRDLERKTVLGNLFETDFNDIWNGEKTRTLRRDLIEKHPERQKACAQCDMPYDASKISFRNMIRLALHRLHIFRP